MRAHRRRVLAVFLGPDLLRAASCGSGDTDHKNPISDGLTKLWSLEDGRVVARLGVLPLGFSSDGALLLAAQDDDLAVIDARTGALLHRHAGIAKRAERAETPRPGVVALDVRGVWREHDLATGAPLGERAVPEPPRPVFPLADLQWAKQVFRRDRDVVETCQGELYARLQPKLVISLRAPPRIVHVCRMGDKGRAPILELVEGRGDLSADGRWLLYGDCTGEVRLWDLQALAATRRLEDPEAFVELRVEDALALRREERARRPAREEAGASAAPPDAVEHAVLRADDLRALRERIGQMLPRPEELDAGRPRPLALSLDHLSVRDGWRLFAKALRTESDGVGRVLAFPKEVHLIAVREWLRRSPFEDRDVPDPEGTVAPLRALEPDGSLAAYVEAVVVASELADFGAYGHFVGWGRERIVDRCEPLEHARVRQETEEDVRDALGGAGLALPDLKVSEIVKLELARRRHSEELERCALEPGVVPDDFVPAVWREPGGTVVVRFATFSGYGVCGYSQTTVRFLAGACDRAESSGRQLATGGAGYVC